MHGSWQKFKPGQWQGVALFLSFNETNHGPITALFK
jgi:hypothetical protein